MQESCYFSFSYYLVSSKLALEIKKTWACWESDRFIRETKNIIFRLKIHTQVSDDCKKSWVSVVWEEDPHEEESGFWRFTNFFIIRSSQTCFLILSVQAKSLFSLYFLIVNPCSFCSSLIIFERRDVQVTKLENISCRHDSMNCR